ncbi:MAG: hypothetical protein WA858_22370, partial [Xanthobacteraceae bacterium]
CLPLSVHWACANFVKFLEARATAERSMVTSYAFGTADALGRSARHSWEEIMDSRLYLTIAAVVAILYSLAFLLLPVQASLFFSGFAEPRAVWNLRFCGAAVLAWGLIVWFARDFRDWDAVRSVLIAEHCGTCGQYRHYYLGDFRGLAQRESVGIGRCARVAVAWGRL